MANTLVWADIPVKDLERASKFYSFLLNTELKKETCYRREHVSFPCKDDEVSGGLVKVADFESPRNSILIYLNLGSRLDEVLNKVEEHGGKILEQKESIEPWGHRAIILDTEGNRIALHSKV